MDVLYARCCGLDIHKRTVVACVLGPGAGGRPAKEVRTFGALTDDLLALSAWLAARGVTHVAMERTGGFWKPVSNLLEERFAPALANARLVKAVPGRKTDVRDCEWLAQLLRHGLLPASFVPDRASRELRELTRYRVSLLRERAAELNRLQKTLEGANIKLAPVASELDGQSARAMRAALARGAADPAARADLAPGKLRAKLPQLERALTGRVGPHQRFLLARQLAHVAARDELVAQVSAEIEVRLRPAAAAVARLDTVPGIGRRTAEVLLAEVGSEVARFPAAAQLASWAGMCPGNRESAGKRLSGRTRKSSPWLRTALVGAAQAAGRGRQTYLGAQYRRFARRLGAKKAAVAVGHAMLAIAYHVLRDGAPYRDLGPAYFEERDRAAHIRAAVRRLERLGHRVTLEPVP